MFETVWQTYLLAIAALSVVQALSKQPLTIGAVVSIQNNAMAIAAAAWLVQLSMR